jgi:site-specific DNA recombinase
LAEQLADLSSAMPKITPDLADLYRARVDALAETLSDPEVVHRASEILGELIDPITIRHDVEPGHTAQIGGKLLGLPGFADSEHAASLSAAACSLKLVKRARFEPESSS